MTDLPPGAVQLVFDPHVVVAIGCLAIAVFIALIVALIPIEDDPERRRLNRRD